MIRNRKTVKGKLGKTRPKDTDFAGIARKQSRTKKTTTKSNRPTDSRTATLRKVLNVDKIKSLGWEPKIGLREGIELTYQWYKDDNRV